MHHGAIPVTFHMEIQTLVRVAPGDFQNRAVATKCPHKFIKIILCLLSRDPIHKVDKRISEGGHGLEVGWHINEIILALETVEVEKPTEIITPGFTVDVFDEYCCFSVDCRLVLNPGAVCP